MSYESMNPSKASLEMSRVHRWPAFLILGLVNLSIVTINEPFIFTKQQQTKYKQTNFP